MIKLRRIADPAKPCPNSGQRPGPRTPAASSDSSIAKLSRQGSLSYFEISSVHYDVAFVCLELIHAALYRDLVEIPPAGMFLV